MIKGGKIWAQPPICKVPKPQYVFYSLPPCTWHLYENIKEQQSSNLYKNSWQSRPAFSIFTHIEAHVGEHVPFSGYSKPQILKYSNIELFKYSKPQIWSEQKLSLVVPRNISLGLDLEAICFYFISTGIHPPKPRYVLTINCKISTTTNP